MRNGPFFCARTAQACSARTILPVLATLAAAGTCLAEPAAFTLPPAMFSLGLGARREAAGELSLLRDFRFGGVAGSHDDVLGAGGFPGAEKPVPLTLFKDVTFAVADRTLPPVVSIAPRAGLPGLVRPLATGGIMALAVGASLQNSLKEPDSANTSGFRFRSEGFFGAHTYTGGADKAAHFVDYTIAARLLLTTYRRIGYTDLQSGWLAAGTSVAAGLATEIGDGTTMFGFSWEDVLMDSLGAATAIGLARYGWDDAFGFRYGTDIPQESRCCANDNYGRDYSGEIYVADVKIAGLAGHMRRDPGFARYFLVSGTYGTNGYRNAPAEMRQRLVGIEVGLHISEVLRSLGVPEKALWGEILYLFFDSIRLPYTAIGVRYDINHHQWFGPTSTGRTPFPQAASR